MKGTNSRPSRRWTATATDASIALGLVAAIVVLLLLGGCSQGENPEGTPSSAHRDAESQVEATIPTGWRALRRPITSVTYPHQVLAAASFPARVPRHPPNCSPGRVLDQMPPSGVLLQVFEYAADDSAGHPVRVPDLAPRPARFRYADAEYGPFECAGYSYKFSFEQGGRAFQAHVWFDRRTVARSGRTEALAILDSFQPIADPAVLR